MNKVKFGLSNVHYAKLESYDEETQKYTFAKPKRIPGAVNLTLDAEGSSTPFYADNIVFFNTKTNAGYSGNLEIACVPDEFRTDILGDTDNDGVIIENADAQGNEFALLFQFEGDVSGRRHVIWRCSAERPSINSATKEDTTEPQTDTLSLTAMARESDHNVKAYCDYPEKGATDFDAKKAKYDNWFDEVWQPTAITESDSGTEEITTHNAKKTSSIL